jgi:hypothetical protein
MFVRRTQTPCRKRAPQMNFLARYRMAIREPRCIENRKMHEFGDQDPDGGWWCARCDVLIGRPPRAAELVGQPVQPEQEPAPVQELPLSCSEGR